MAGGTKGMMLASAVAAAICSLLPAWATCHSAPAAWRAWLRCGETTQLARVMQHNYQDVISLALLHQRLIEVYAGASGSGIDHPAIVRSWCDAG